MIKQGPIAVRRAGETDSDFSFRIHCLAFDNDVAKKETYYCRDQDSVKDDCTSLMHELDSVIKLLKERSKKEVHRSVNTSMRYFGEPGSRTCWHVGNSDLKSCNCFLGGCETCWAMIDSVDYPKLVEYLKKHGKNIKGCGPFHENSVSIDPRSLQKRGIKVRYSVQRPGDFVLIGPGFLHAVMNVGFNDATAMNVITWAVAHNEDITRKYCNVCSEEEIGRKPR
ncbi:hypothetical protein QAD02_019890 [Eretmocerus hayati]|uniref:Uncharacterized protein n=1 Tax=Eretmocerus hayati TaxID=131215 RepID=A0ACC2PKV4_9HYME|nr:hypothetical protein QAD02_019890 [Eretmocerus hayati]